MLRFLGRRLVNLVLVLFFVVSGMFFALHLMPGSPVNSLPPAIAADPVARTAYAESLGLNDPLLVQYWNFLVRLIQLDFGVSIYDGTRVIDQIGAHLPVSMELGVLAAAGSMIPGLALGVWTAMRLGAAVDAAIRVFTVLALSVPAYWLAVLALVFVGRRFPQLLPSAGGYVPFTEDAAANLQVMLLPSLVLGLSTFALVARSLRAALADVLSFDYITFAQGMGMRRRVMMSRIAVRNAIIPTLTVMGVLLGGLISGTVLIESVFQIPGLGQLMVTAFLRQDYPLALGCAVFTTALFLLLNLVVDALYHVIDPRIKAGEAMRL